jgi:hypothetical protein
MKNDRSTEGVAVFIRLREQTENNPSSRVMLRNKILDPLAQRISQMKNLKDIKMQFKKISPEEIRLFCGTRIHFGQQFRYCSF